MSKLQPVRGTHDLLPEEFSKFLAIINTARKLAVSYGFEEIATPIFEFTEVFSRSVGETSDIVNKEMYSFLDRGGESITLRPEFTAGIVRSFISNGLQQNLPCKFFSNGPVFRYERPQKGRQRQFHQLNFEWLGAGKPSDDAETIEMAATLLRELNVKAELNINSLGDTASRQNYQKVLVEYFNDHRANLSDDSKIRLEKNPLRILDSKDEGDKKINANAPRLEDHLNEESVAYYSRVKDYLEELDLTFVQNSNLVRGLDYYNHVVFEFVSGDLGAQNTVLAGGRYDGLVSTMGGPATPAVGWGAGLERLMLISDIKTEKTKPICVIAGDDDLKAVALKIAQTLRRQGKAVEVASQTNFKKALQYANKIGASEAYIYGGNEAANHQVTVKDLNSGEQKTLPLSALSL